MNTVRLLLFSVFLFLFPFSRAAAQSVPPELDNALKQTLIYWRNLLGVQSLSAAVQFSNDSVWTGAYGISSTFPADSVTPDHAYAIGSITKTITAACILQLADEDKLNLDDSLHTWLPDFPYVDPNIRIRQLLNHQSGLYDVITDPAYNAASTANLDSVWSLTNLVNDYIAPPLFAPGTSWSYSNTNYALLGLIVEAASGNTYHDEYKNRFFNPLNLPSLLLPPYDPLPSEIAHLWLYNPANGQISDEHNFFSNWHSFTTSAGPIGGYYGTAGDIARWNRAFLRGDLHSPQILTEAKNTVASTMPANGRYGLGIMERKFLGLTAYGHGGDIGYSSISYYFPQKDISVTVLNNDSRKTSWALAPIVQALLKTWLDFESGPLSAGNDGVERLKTAIYPNPFCDRLSVSVDLPSDVSSAQVVLTDVLGREVHRVEAGALQPGQHNIALEGLEDLAAGAYFASLSLDGVSTATTGIIKQQ